MSEYECSIEEIETRVKAGKRLLGLDLGTKTIGLALSDSLQGIATPMETVRRKKFTPDAQKIIEIIKEHEVGGLVMGLPVNMDGTEGPRCQSSRAFARNFQNLYEIPVTFWDERLSTVAVERTLIEADSSRAKRAEVIDKMAAAYILQGALDRIQMIRQED